MREAVIDLVDPSRQLDACIPAIGPKHLAAIIQDVIAVCNACAAAGVTGTLPCMRYVALL
jgi:hypothetical protein